MAYLDPDEDLIGGVEGDEIHLENNIENDVAKIASKISLGDINYSLKLSKEFKPTINNLEQIIKSLLRSDLLEWEKIFNKIKNKNDIIDLVKLLNIFLNDA